MAKRKKIRRQARRERVQRAFYEHCLPASARRTEPLADEQNADEAELRRQARSVLYTQPEDRALVMRSRAVLGGDKGRPRSKELGRNFDALYKHLEEQLLPRRGEPE